MPPHAPCRLQHNPAPRCPYCGSLCLHTLRADCNCRAERMQLSVMALLPHAPCRLQPDDAAIILSDTPLCLHTLRADCNHRPPCEICCAEPLPPHAPCRLQLRRLQIYQSPSSFASTRSVQIATILARKSTARGTLCLHTLRADCNRNPVNYAAGQNFFASTRSVQIATAEMHRMQYALFRTCVESVDSFSVLNKSMLR